ncbi:unnamed protein product [Clonostachys rhizophaga]|uniref:Uncharacterized protein n=1 Tax=Clonostachys rhizophaga TaxID=160324 RepID=A0A9N9YJK4_9HYPO|nr:unnamed protein product [Clonostachys rhizophaga]
MESGITGPVTPPSTYSTKFELPLPKRVELELSTETPERAKKTIAENLENLKPQSELPYGPVQFWKLLSRYYTIARSRLEEVCGILARETEEPIQLILDAKSDEVTIPLLVQEINENLDLVLQIVVEIEKEVLPSLGVDVTLDLSSLAPTLPSPGVDVSPDLSSVVTNISLHECRLWPFLNTKEFHQKLQEAKGEKAKLSPTREDVAAVISARHIMGNPPLVVKLKRS